MLKKHKYTKKADFNNKVGRYFIQRELKGATQAEAQVKAGYGKGQNGPRVEKTKTYQKLKHKYKDILLGKIDLGKIADYQIRNAEQSENYGASNQAIEGMLERIEPKEQADVEIAAVKIKLTKK